MLNPNIAYYRRFIKRSNGAGVIPTINTGLTSQFADLDITEFASIGSTDLFDGEMFANTLDKRFFIRLDDQIVEFSVSGGTIPIGYYIPLTGSTVITGELTPLTNDIYDLGDKLHTWHNAYVGNHIYLGAGDLSVTGSTLYLNGQAVEMVGEIPRYYKVASMNGDFSTIQDAISFLSAATGNAFILLSPEDHYITDTITINLPYNVEIRGSGYDLTNIYPAGGMLGKPMFNLYSSVIFNRLKIDGTDLSGYGTGVTENILNSIGNGSYYELNDAALIGGYNNINQTSNSEWWIFNSVINDAKSCGYRLKDNNGARFRTLATDYSHNADKGIFIESGTSIYVSIQECTSELTTSGQTFFYADMSAVTYTECIVTNNAWNNIGKFYDGIDFTLSGNSDIYMVNNVGIEDLKPHFKINSQSGTTATTLTQNVWTKVVLDPAKQMNYTKKWTISGNKATYQPSHEKDVMMWVSYSLNIPQNGNHLLQIGVAKNGITTSMYGVNLLTLDQNGRSFNGTTNVYIPNVVRGDYFELYVMNISDSDDPIFSTINWMSMSN